LHGVLSSRFAVGRSTLKRELKAPEKLVFRLLKPEKDRRLCKVGGLFSLSKECFISDEQSSGLMLI